VGKDEKVKICFSFSFHWPPSNGTFQGPPSNKNLPRATKQWNLPLATELGSSFTSLHFLLLKTANSDHLELSFQRILFNSNMENTCSHNLLEEENND
jgi:hypothetical protein